jgi:hypothetical protein
MSSEEENREVTVRAPSKPVVSPDKREEKTTQKALEEERFGVLLFPKKISRYLGYTCAVLGLVLLALFAIEISSQTGSLIFSAQSGSVLVGLWVFVGLFNIIIGFLFLGRD